MKKLIMYGLTVTVLGLGACSKSDSAKSSTWNIKSKDYTASSVVANSSGLSAINTAGPASITVNFAGTALPTASGTYNMVTTLPLNANECTVDATIGTDTYTQVGGGSANVTISSGKVSVSASNIKVAHNTDTTTVTFNIAQP